MYYKTIKQIKDALLSGEELTTQGECSANETRRHWIDDAGVVRSKGSGGTGGSSWEDMDDLCLIQDIDEFSKHLYSVRSIIIPPLSEQEFGYNVRKYTS